jgi:hypothetical protein
MRRDGVPAAGAIGRSRGLHEMSRGEILEAAGQRALGIPGPAAYKNLYTRERGDAGQAAHLARQLAG